MDGKQICENCKRELTGKAPQPSQISNEQASLGILKGKDGVLRWVYEMNMWKNPTLVFTIWKVLLLAAFVPAILVLILGIGDGVRPAFLTFLKVYAMVAGSITGLMLLAYPLVAIINGGKYCVLFEMDDAGVKHIQIQKQFKRNQILSMVTILAGIVAGNLQTTSAGLLAATKQSSYSQFSKVKSIIVHKKRGVIYLNENIASNQVYANLDDFAFVTAYILSRCKDANMKEK